MKEALFRKHFFFLDIQHNAIIELQKSPFAFNVGIQNKFCFFPSVLGDHFPFTYIYHIYTCTYVYDTYI